MPRCATRSSARSWRRADGCRENELAELLGVSRTPIREALARLRDERLVAIVPQLGTFVTLHQLRRPSRTPRSSARRSSAPPSAARSSTSTDAGLATLAGQPARAGARASERGDVDAFDVLDDAFHRLLCDLSGHEIVWSLARRAKGHLNRVRAAQPARARLPRRDGRRAPRARRGDRRRTIPTRAEAALRHHLRMVLSRASRTSAASTPTTSRSPDGGRNRSRPDARRIDARAETGSSCTSTMVLIRVFETEAERQYKAARIGGYCHLSSGQEATTVGAVHALRARRPARHRLPLPRLRARPRRRRRRP